MNSTSSVFPSDFVFGAATSAAQIEGGANQHGKSDSIWDQFCRQPGTIADSSDISTACDHYNLMEQDVELMRDLNLESYRFSLSWPRIRPDDKDFNPEGIDFYSRLVDRLLEANISPWITLYHWDLPQALQNNGGWTSRDTAYRFAEYAAYAYKKLGDRVTQWTTLNEPWCSAFLGHCSGNHAPGFSNPADAAAAAHHLLLAHGLAVKEIRDLASRRSWDLTLGITLNFTSIHPDNPDDKNDVELAQLLDARQNRFFVEPITCGSYPTDLLLHFGACGIEKRIHDGDLSLICAPIDVLGVNYYTGYKVKAKGDIRPLCCDMSEQFDYIERDLDVTAMGWEVCPDDFKDMLVRLYNDYLKKAEVPIVITENGAAFDDAPNDDGFVDDTDTRLTYIRDHLVALRNALDQGVDIRGYYVWSLLDNFEWEHGYTKRFGIVRVDYETLKRIPKASGIWYANVAKTHTIGTIDEHFAPITTR